MDTRQARIPRQAQLDTAGGSSWRRSATPDEIRRREEALDRILKRRLEMPLLPAPAAELIRLARQDNSAANG